MPLTKIQSGFTLLEVLVAIVVLSLGLLGLAGLQAASLRNNQTAYYRGIAIQQAYDMGDRIRANLAGVRDNEYKDLTSPPFPTDPGCFTTGCTDVTMAKTDYFQWLTTNASLLPGGGGTVHCEDGPATAGCDAATGNWVFNITVFWTERTEAGSGTQSFVTRISP
jgi:type IV pilus assembly protein PilV